MECAFVAVSYALGRRAQQLSAQLDEPCFAAQSLVEQLQHRDRVRRAKTLAQALLPIAAALDARRVL
jgi:hypothetical protein